MRGLIALLMLGLVLYTGASHKSYWSLALLGGLFTVAYVDSKFDLWLDKLVGFQEPFLVWQTPDDFPQHRSLQPGSKGRSLS